MNATTTAPPRDAWRRVLLLGLAAGVAAPVVGTAVALFGFRVPHANMGGDYALALLWATGLTALLAALPLREAHRRALIALWLVRCFVTLGFMLFYEYWYGLDSYAYYQIALTRGPAPIRFGDGTAVVETFSWLHLHTIPYSYHAVKVTLSFVGLAAVYTFYRAAVLFLRREDMRILYLLGLFPSILFWSSIYGKEPLVLLGLGLYTLGVIGWHRTRAWRFVWILLLGAACAMQMRIWLGPVLMLPLVVLAFRGVHGFLPRLAFLIVAAAGVVFAVQHFLARFGLASIQDLIETTTMLSQLWAQGGSGQKLAWEFHSLQDLVGFLPVGAFTALYRPLPGEVMNPFGLMAGAENLLLLGLTLIAVLKFRPSVLREPLVLWALLMVLGWAALYAVISYQNLGTATRFKAQIMPVFLGLLLYLAARRRIPRAASAAPVLPQPHAAAAHDGDR